MFFTLRNLGLVLLCICYALFRGTARSCKTPSRVLVFPSGKLGDVICTTPVFHALKQSGALVYSAEDQATTRQLLLHGGFVDDFVDTHSFWRGVYKARMRRFDACVVTGPTFRSVALAYLAGIPCIVAPRVVGGFSPQYSTKSYQLIKRFVTTTPFEMGEYAPKERLKMLAPLGIQTSDTTKRLGYSRAAEEKVAAFLHEQGISKDDFFVGITLSAGNKIKEWPVERFGEVADYIGEHGKGKVAIIGGPNDHELSKKTKKTMRTQVIDTTGMWNIDELKAFIARLDLFISVDTGPIYIAEAFDVPTIDIVGPMDEREQPPRGPLTAIVLDRERAEPALHIMNARVYDRQEARRQIEKIDTSQVICAFDDLVARIHASNTGKIIR